MRVDITQRPVGSFFGGKPSASTSVECPVCSKPALRIKDGILKGKRTRHYAHRLTLKLNSKNEPTIEWDEPCVEGGGQ